MDSLGELNFIIMSQWFMQGITKAENILHVFKPTLAVNKDSKYVKTTFLLDFLKAMGRNVPQPLTVML